MERKIKITVFTPVYNRGYCVRDVYESLLRQNYRDFEWLVINDGSTDNTEAVINGCIQERKISIRYIAQKNGGQHRALNCAIKNAKGSLIMIVDSDDKLTDDALSCIDCYEKSIIDKSGFAGVSGLRCYSNGEIIGSAWSAQNDFVDLTNIERYKYDTLLGDKAEAYYTDVLKKFYPIPEFLNENDVEKGVLWNRIGNAGLKIRWFNKPIYICEYLNDGMTKNIVDNYIKNFKGYTLFIKELIKYDIGNRKKIKMIIRVCEISHKRKETIYNVAKLIEYPYIKLLFLNFISYFTPIRFLLKKN